MTTPDSVASSVPAFPTLRQHSGMLQAGGHALDYRWLQPVDASWQQRPMLVWLHQGLGSSTMWRDFPEQLMLRTGCASLIYSRYGHGQSDAMAEARPPQFMDIEGVSVLPQVLDWLIRSPMLSDLRESGSLEQDADMVILLHREDAYERESPRAGEADFIVAKHRNGPTDTVTVAFQGHYSRFVDMAQQ